MARRVTALRIYSVEAQVVRTLESPGWVQGSSLGFRVGFS